MSDGLRARADALFDRALDMPREQRAELIREASAEDPLLAREVEALLRLADDPHPPDTDWAEASASLWSDLASELERDVLDEADRRVGAWRLIEEIGHGGMGTVYLAERADGAFEQRAALKRLRPAIATGEALRRFEQERQILADLAHPGIARLIDGGRTADGHPFLVMELIEGLPIDRYCREQGLDVSQRLALFAAVCRAVAHAHRHMVVHRDLKPSNILVSPTGHVTLLDFGIARLLPPDDAASPVAGAPAEPHTLARALTPEYASPEQLTGAPVTVASDVYQLGLLLHELLTDQRPYDLRGASPRDLERIICHEPARRPSTVVAAQRGLARRLRGDLDSIVQEALRKEPERRYPSVDRLLDDVERHLSGRPVSARGDTAAYRAGRFVRRHPVGVGAAALVALLIVVWAITATVQARAIARERDRARAEAVKAEQVKAFVLRLFQQTEPETARGEALSARELLDRGWASIQTELANQPEVQAELLDTVGQIYRELGAYDRADPLLARALELARRLDDGAQPLLATTMRNSARLRRERGDYDAAETLLTEALARQRRLLGDTHRDVATTLNELALTHYAGGDYTRATPLFGEALAMRRQLFGDSHADVADSLDKLGMAFGNLGDYKAAEPLLRESLALRRRLLPANHPSLATSLSDLAWVVQSLGDLPAAEALYRESLSVMTRSRGERHPYVAVTMNNLARLLRAKGDLPGAEAMLRQALAIRREALGPAHPQIAMNLSDLGRLLYDKGAPREAERLYHEALAIYPPAHPWRAVTIFNLGRLLEDRRDYARAEAHYRDALVRQRTQYGADHERVGVDLRQLGIVQVKQRRWDDAEASLRQALAIFRKRLPASHPRLADTLLPLGNLLIERRRAAEAEPLLREAVAIQETAFGPGDPRGADGARSLARAVAAQRRAP